MACERDNFITHWLRAFIFLPHVHDTNLKVKVDIQWLWGHQVTETKIASKRDNFIDLNAKFNVTAYMNSLHGMSIDLPVQCASRLQVYSINLSTDLYTITFIDITLSWSYSPSASHHHVLRKSCIVSIQTTFDLYQS